MSPWKLCCRCGLGNPACCPVLLQGRLLGPCIPGELSGRDGVPVFVTFSTSHFFGWNDICHWVSHSMNIFRLFWSM